MSGAINVRLFGPAREAAGVAEIALSLPPLATAGELVATLAQLHPGLAPLLPRSRVAVNRAYVEPATLLTPGDEIAIIPPVGGG